MADDPGLFEAPFVPWLMIWSASKRGGSWRCPTTWTGRMRMVGQVRGHFMGAVACTVEQPGGGQPDPSRHGGRVPRLPPACRRAIRSNIAT